MQVFLKQKKFKMAEFSVLCFRDAGLRTTCTCLGRIGQCIYMKRLRVNFSEKYFYDKISM